MRFHFWLDLESIIRRRLLPNSECRSHASVTSFSLKCLRMSFSRRMHQGCTGLSQILPQFFPVPRYSGFNFFFTNASKRQYAKLETKTYSFSHSSRIFSSCTSILRNSLWCTIPGSASLRIGCLSRNSLSLRTSCLRGRSEPRFFRTCPLVPVPLAVCTPTPLYICRHPKIKFPNDFE